MALARKKPKPIPRKDYGEMQSEWNLIDATISADLNRIKECLKRRPESIHDVDKDGNNAMHVLVMAGASIRGAHFMQFFVEETEINLLHKNNNGMDPFDLACAMGDEPAMEILEMPTHRQMDRMHDEENRPVLTIVKRGSQPDDPDSGPK